MKPGCNDTYRGRDPVPVDQHKVLLDVVRQSRRRRDATKREVNTNACVTKLRIFKALDSRPDDRDGGVVGKHDLLADRHVNVKVVGVASLRKQSEQSGLKSSSLDRQAACLELASELGNEPAVHRHCKRASEHRRGEDQRETNK